MHAGIILLTWLILAVVVVSALVASGIISIHIEIEDKRKKCDEDEDTDSGVKKK